MRGPAIYLKEVDRFKGIQGIDNDDIYGYVDTHSHISAYEFIGGRINYGAPFHKFGVTHALEDCEVALWTRIALALAVAFRSDLGGRRGAVDALVVRGFWLVVGGKT